jgi:antitoxin component YwqK of YwqJK toxin-antitoxin module
MPPKETRTIRNAAGSKIAEAECENGAPNGITRTWSDEGVLTLEAQLSDGDYDGPYRSWWNNGQPKEEGTFRKGKRIGLYRWFREDETLWSEHDYGDAV